MVSEWCHAEKVAMEIVIMEHECSHGDGRIRNSDFAVSNVRIQTRLPKIRHHSLPSTSYLCYVLTRQHTRSKLSEGDGDKIVRNKRKRFSSSRFSSLLFNIIGP